MNCESKCPKCGNINVLTEKETDKTINCKSCFNYYELGITRIFDHDFLDDSI